MLFRSLFQIEKVNFLRFENIEVRNSDAAGFIVRGPECKKIELIGCKSHQTHNSGIGLWYCDSVLVSHCEITAANDNSDQYFEPGQRKGGEVPHEALSICGARYFEVANNHIHHCFKEGIDCKEVSQHGVIHNNLVHDVEQAIVIVPEFEKVRKLEQQVALRSQSTSCILVLKQERLAF